MTKARVKGTGPLRVQRRINFQLRRELREMRTRLARALLDNENLQANESAWRQEALHFRKQYDQVQEEFEQQAGQLDSLRHPEPRKSWLARLRLKWWF